MTLGTGVLLKVPADNGCKQATEYLGAQSHCLECPFYECKEVSNQWRSDSVSEAMTRAKANGVKFGRAKRGSDAAS